MIELSNFDLSSIITKLNQGVEETSAGHGSDFEKVLTEHLELSGIKSGKPYPLLNTPEEKIDQNGVSDDPGRLDIKNRSDLSSLTLSKFADQLSPIMSVCEVCLRPHFRWAHRAGRCTCK